MTKANTQFCNKFDSSMIFTFKNTVGGWPDKFQDIDNFWENDGLF